MTPHLILCYNSCMKKFKSESLELFGAYDSYKLEDLVNLLTEAIQELPEDQRESARFEVVKEPEPYSDYDRVSFQLQYQRLETDEEEQAREAQEAQWAEQREQAQRAEFERLKKLFGE